MTVEPTDFFISDDDFVDCRYMGDMCEIKYLKHKNICANIQKLSKHTYLDKSSGEIKPFTHTANRKQGVNSLRQTFNKLRYLINNNFTEKPNELLVTLTYKENMTEIAKLEKDFDNFIKRLRRYLQKQFQDKGGLEYIAIREPQERGAWHIHLLLKTPSLNKLYISNDEMQSIWKNGFTKTTRLKNISNIGAYLTAYLTDLLLPDDIDFKEESDIEYMNEILAQEGSVSIHQPKSDCDKKVVKGGRLALYPPNLNIYTKSSGLKYPVVTRERYRVLKNKGFLPENITQRKAFKLIDNDRDFKNTIITEQYNRKIQNWSLNNTVFQKKWAESVLNAPEEHSSDTVSRAEFILKALMPQNSNIEN